MSFDDLYNNFKIVEQEVKRTVSTANSLVSTDSTLDSTTNLSDTTVYAFLANQPNGSQPRTGKKITINGSDTAGYDKSKVECFNYHKMGHFARECRGPRNQESRPRNQDSSRRTVIVGDTSSKAMMAIDGAVVNAVRDNQENAVKALACWGIPPTDDQGYVDNGCSRHMTGNISYLSYFQEFDGGYVTFGGGVRGGKITGKGTLKTGKLDFQDLPDESQILLKISRKNNMYSVDMKNIVPKESLTCLVAKATLDESMLWHMRLGYINFKTINKLVKDNLVRGLPSKRFENDQTCVACLKGKQHKASSSKDEISGILKNFITEIENLVDKKVKIIRCDNGTEFKNRVMNEFCEQKGIKREYSVARTP
ncbi:ribonuclease H-like domain-containing protein [Tanacetum coccineum]